MDDGQAKAKKHKVKIKSSVKSNKTDFRWAIKIVAATFVLSAAFNVTSTAIMNRVNVFVAFLILIFIILIGILFDMVGIAITAADEIPFRSMASHKVRGSRRAIWLIRNRDKASNFCNDVVGDICGIVSGAGAVVIANFIISSNSGVSALVVTLVITSITAALTVGGKALGKAVSISRCNNIVYYAALLMDLFGKPKK